MTSRTGLDTNILVRFVMADDPVQSPLAHRLLQSFSSASPGFISLVSLAEMVWVLRKKYRQPKSLIVHWLTRFLESPELVLEGPETVASAVKAFANGNAHFADCLIERCGHVNGCALTVTFDKNAAKTAGMRLLR